MSAAPASPGAVPPLELPGLEVVVLDRDGESPQRRVQRRSLRHRPGAEHAAELEPEIEVQRRGVVQLDDEPAHPSRA